MRLKLFDGDDEEIRAAGGRAAHIDQRQTCAHKHTGKNGRQETVARVQRRQREHKVQKQRGNDHRLETLEQKLAPHHLIADDDDGNVDDKGHRADGQIPQIIADQRQARHAAGRKIR